MSSNGFLLTLELTPLSRRAVLAWLWIAGCAAGIAVAFVDAPRVIQVLLATALMTATALSTPPAIERLTWSGSGPATLFFRGRAARRATFMGGWVCGPIAGLRWRLGNGRTCAVFVRAAGPRGEDWRRLRVRLWFPRAIG